MSPRNLTVAQLAAFKAIDSLADVADFFGTTVSRLSYHLYSWRRPRYRVFQLRKASGGYRTIAAPPPMLAALQTQLLRYMTALVVPKPAAHGFTVTRSVRTNATPHLRANLLLNLDLKDFFTSIHFGRVRGVFSHAPFEFNPSVSAVLAHLCCYEAHLPQGAPTSPLITNLICRRLDRHLAMLARRHNCRYTRYADDITISTRGLAFPQEIVGRATDRSVLLGAALMRVLSAQDLTVNPLKTRVQSHRQRQTVTGIVVNQKLNLPRAAVRRIRAILHSCEVAGLASANRAYQARYDHKQRLTGIAPDILDHVRGKIDYLGMIRGVDDPLYTRLAIRSCRLDLGRRPAVPVHRRASFQPDLLAAAFHVVLGRDQHGSEVTQGTAFSLQGVGLVSAAHVFQRWTSHGDTVETWEIRDPETPAVSYPVRAILRFSGLDLAILETDFRPVACLRRALSEVATGDVIRIAGYPQWRPHEELEISPAVVQQARSLSGVRHILTSASFREGTSGGAILQGEGLAAGIVVYDANATAAPRSGIAIRHIDEVRGAARIPL